MGLPDGAKIPGVGGLHLLPSRPTTRLKRCTRSPPSFTKSRADPAPTTATAISADVAVGALYGLRKDAQASGRQSAFSSILFENKKIEANLKTKMSTILRCHRERDTLRGWNGQIIREVNDTQHAMALERDFILFATFEGIFKVKRMLLVEPLQ